MSAWTVSNEELRATPMTRVSVRLLGEFEVAVDGNVVTDFESASSRALLARVAAELGRPLPRSMLAELLWPDRPAGSAAGNLRHALTTVRRAIGDADAERPILATSGSTIALESTADVDVDLADFERLASVALNEPGAVAAWEAAIKLRRGAFLDGFEGRSSEAWDTWVITMRRWVDERATTVLRRLAELRERTGERRAARELARQWIELDPLDESAHRMLIRLLALDDRRAAALVHGDELTEALASELGIEPAPETRALVDDVRAGRFPVRVPDVPALRLRVPGDLAAEPCVGRDDELRWLRDRFESSRGGSGRVVFVVGQPGAGKSVLLRTFEREAVESTPSLVVVRATCLAHSDARVPFLPIRRVLQQLLGDLELDWINGLLRPSEAAQLWAGVPAAVEAMLDLGPSLLGTIVDGEALLRRFEDGFADHVLVRRLRAAVDEAGARASDPTRRRQPLVDQCAAVLMRLATVQPLLITIDDLQWADSGSLDVLTAFASGIGRLPVLVIAALRPGETEHGHDVVGRTVHRIASRSLEPCEVVLGGSRAFVDAWLDVEPNSFDQAFRDRLYRTTGGNALFTVEFVRALRRDGHLAQDDRGRWFVQRQHDWGELPPRVEATVAARLDELPEELRRDLEFAAVQGLEFSAEAVALARGVGVQDVVLRLSSLCVTPNSLLRSAGSELAGQVHLHRFRFRHALFRRHLLDRMAAPIRRVVHEATGAALEQTHTEGLTRVAGELAAHFDAAGVVDKAIEFGVLAGREASRMSAHDDAALHFERALELVAMLEPSPEVARRELELLTLLGSCHQSHFGYNASQTTRVYERIRDLTRIVPPSLESAGAIGGLLTVDGLRAKYAQALAEAEQLLDLADELDAPAIESVARVQLGWMLLMVGRLVEADEQLSMCIERYDRSWDVWLTPTVGLHVLSTAQAWRAITSWHLGRLQRALELGDRSIVVAREARFPFGLAFALSVGGCLLGELLEDAERITSAADEVAAIARAEDFAFYSAAAELHAGSALLLSDEPTAGVESMRRGLAAWADLGTDAFATWSRTWLAEAYIRGGHLDDARRELAAIDGRLAHGEERLAELRRGYVGAMLRRAEGDVDGAAVAYRDLIDAARAARARGPELQAVAALEALTDATS